MTLEGSSLQPTIRKAENRDVLPIAKVHILSWRETYPGLLPEQMLANLSISNEAIRWQRLLDEPHQEIAFVAARAEDIVGYGSCGAQRTALLHEQGFTSEIEELYVLRHAQGQGTGSGLARAMAGALLQLGHRQMSLWVLAHNSAARRFYERLGGTPIATKGTTIAEVAYGWTDLSRLASGHYWLDPRLRPSVKS